MDYNKLSQTAHAAAKKNGWYEGEQVSINTKLALVKSEIYEAFEAFRKGEYVNHKRLSMLYTYIHSEDYLKNLENELIKKPVKQSAAVNNFKFGIKDTFEDEIADTVIRICDFCGWYGIELGGVLKVNTSSKGNYDKDLVRLDMWITKLYNKPNKKQEMKYVFTHILGILESISVIYNFDLEQHINLKLAYNATRGPKHGGKKL